jgi:hypothetical protein
MNSSTTQIMNSIASLALLSAVLVSLPESGHAAGDSCLAEPGPDLHAAASVNCDSAPSATFDNNGRLWVAFVQNQHVYVSYSDSKGAAYSTPVPVNRKAEDAEFNGENRPKIIVDENGAIYVSWTLKTSPRFTGEIRFSRSLDGAQTFETPRTINDDNLATGHRFESLFQTESGKLYLTWIDKRDLEASLVKNQDYAGAAVYYAVSEDGGKNFSKNFRVANNSCECCRIAIAPSGPDNIAILWRQIFGETTRDHAIGVLTPEGKILQTQRASYDDWQINACPHHGPTMVQSSQSGDYHMSWFTNGNLHQGIYYARYSFSSQSPEHVFQVDGNPGAGHPYLAEFGGILYLVWKGFDGQQSLIQVIESSDDGKSWSAPRLLKTTNAGSDHPLIVTGSDGLYLSWKSDQYGYIFEKFTAAGKDNYASD